MSFLRVLLILLIVFVWAHPLQAEKFYVWKDKDGVLNMTNSPGAVPPEMRKQKGIDRITPVQMPNPPQAPKMATVESPKPPAATPEKAETSDEKQLHDAAESLKKRNDSIKKLQEMLKKLVK